MPGRTPEQTLDEYLVLACREGSQQAFAELYRRWQPRLQGHAGHLLGRSLHDRIGDVCQDAWLAIARGLHQLEDPRLFRAWAYAIVTRRVADLRRRLGREREAGRRLATETPDSPNPEPAADDMVARQDALRRALDTLPRDDRALLRLFYLDELSVAETAAALAIPVGTVKSRLFHARARLREAIQRMTT